MNDDDDADDDDEGNGCNGGHDNGYAGVSEEHASVFPS